MTPQERADFIADIAAALSPKPIPVEVLSDDEVRALKLLIKRQEQSIAFRQSVIDKSLSALMVALALGAFGLATAWFGEHIYKP